MDHPDYTRPLSTSRVAQRRLYHRSSMGDFDRVARIGNAMRTRSRKKSNKKPTEWAWRV